MAGARGTATMLKSDIDYIVIPFTVDEYMAEMAKVERGPESVLVASIAAAFKMGRSNLNKKLRKWGFKCVQVRTVEANGMLTNALSPEDARRACDKLIEEGYGYLK